MNWISIEEDYPDPGKVVIVADCINEFVSLGRVRIDSEDNMFIEFMGLDEIEPDCIATHWMPLPTISM